MKVLCCNSVAQVNVLNALTLLVGQQEGHLANKNFSFRTPWEAGLCK